MEKINDPWLAQSERQNNKQHCNKIAQGLEKFDSKSPSRAIWELVQNARDLSRTNPLTENKECHIKMTLTPDEFIFSHKGKSFNFDSLSSLVKQVSSEEKEDEESVGQYGTGFITTHSFGRRILIDGSLNINDIAPGKFVDIDGFEIDRTFDSIPEFIDKMTNQTTRIFEYKQAPRVNTEREWTSLRYQLYSADKALQKAQEGIEAAIKVMPYVMTINDRIVSVIIENKVDGTSMSFTQEQAPDENGLKVKRITIAEGKESTIKHVYYLQSEDKKDIVILPLRDATHAESLKGIAKLFVWFPLLGTEDFGMDFIFHSERFFPVESRNGIHLPKDDKNTENKYLANVQTLKEMSEMVFEYLKEHVAEIEGLVDVCKLCFKTTGNEDSETDTFFEDMKNLWSKQYLDYPMIPTADGCKSIGSGMVKLLDSNITETVFNEESDSLSTVYHFASEVAILPNMEEVLKWTDNLYSWTDDVSDYVITLKDIANNVTEANDFENLHKLLVFIKEAGKSDLFKDYALIPNRNGQLYKCDELVDAAEVPHALFVTCVGLIPSKTSHFVHEGFSDICSLSSYGRKELSRDINEQLRREDQATIDQGRAYNNELIISLIELCSYYPVLPAESLRSKVMPIIEKYYSVEHTERLLTNIPGDDTDMYRIPFARLIESTFIDISKKDCGWVKENIDLLHDIIASLSSSDLYANTQRGLRDKYAIYPNLDDELCLGKELYKNEDVEPELLEIAKRALDKDYQKMIVLPEFETFFDFDVLTAKSIGREIEQELTDGQICSDVMLDIIDHLDKGEWNDIFKYIKENKEKLFFEQVQGNRRDSIYKLMKTDEDTLAAFAELIDNQDISSILAQAHALVDAEKQKQANFEFKYRVGKNIEDVLRNELREELADTITVEVIDNQYGQDIEVLKSGEPIYFIEVKAKWNFSEPAHMSKYQMLKAIENPNRYALCCVDLTSHDVDFEYPDFETALAHTYVHLDIAEKLQPIMEGIRNAGNADTENIISMGGDYHCNIPKRVFCTGKDFQCLIDKIKRSI